MYDRIKWKTRSDSILYHGHRRKVSNGEIGNLSLCEPHTPLYRIAVWDISDRLYEAIEDVTALEEDPTSTATKFAEPVYFYRAHQSGVNGLAVALQNGD